MGCHWDTEVYTDGHLDVCRIREIDTKLTAKYFGVMINSKMAFGKQFDALLTKLPKE